MLAFLGTLAISFGAGALTLLNPCVLPLLPIVLAAALRESRWGPVALGAGLTVSFTLLGLVISAFGFQIGLSTDFVRMIAAIVLVLCGVILLVPKAQDLFASATQPIASGGQALMDRAPSEGALGQFFVGLLLGAVWTPCVGPTLGAAFLAASQQENLAGATATFFFFGLGTATALLAFSYGSRGLLAQRKQSWSAVAKWSKPLLGGTLLLVGFMIFFGWDKWLEAAVLSVMPDWLIDLTTGL